MPSPWGSSGPAPLGSGSSWPGTAPGSTVSLTRNSQAWQRRPRALTPGETKPPSLICARAQPQGGLPDVAGAARKTQTGEWGPSREAPWEMCGPQGRHGEGQAWPRRREQRCCRLPAPPWTRPHSSQRPWGAVPAVPQERPDLPGSQGPGIPGVPYPPRSWSWRAAEAACLQLWSALCPTAKL